MSPAQKTVFFTQLATMSRGGLPISQAFQVLGGNLRSPLVESMKLSIEEGNSLEQVFDRPEFADFEKSAIAAGNQTGQLAVSFAALADHWQRELDLQKSLRQTLMYPVILLHVAMILGPIGKIVSGVGNYLGSVVLSLGTLYLAVFAVYYLVLKAWRSSSGQSALLRIPLVGQLARRVFALRWIQITRMEFSAGLGLPQAVADAWRGTGMVDGPSIAQGAQEALLEGRPLSEVCAGWFLLPGSWKSYLAAAEISGQLTSTLDFLGSEAEKDYLRARKYVEEWVPKGLSVIVLLAVGLQIVVSYLHTQQETMKMIDGI